MSTNGILDFQGTNKATFVGTNSNVVIDTVNASFGVGVDVNGPTSNLHVVGNAYVTSNLEVGTANLFVDTVNSRVGVGTDAPIEKLDVRGAIIAPVVSYSSNQDAPYLIAGTPGYTGAATSWNTHGFQHRIKSDSGGTPRITVDTPSGGEAFSIVNGGNVGIGTATPRTNLHIGQQLNSQGDKNTIPAAGLGISANFPSSTHAWFAHRSNATGDEYWGLAVGTIYSGSSYLQNLNKNSGIYYNLLLQPNGGNVGIGTTTPTAKLHIKSSSGVDGIAIVNPAGGTGGLLNSSAGVRGGILISNSGGGLDAADNYSSQPIVFSGGGTGATNGNIRGGSIWSIWGGSQYGLAFKGASDGDSVPAGATPPNMFISSDKVGIGTTSPSRKLDVHSSARPSNYPFAIGGTGTNKANYVAVTVNPGNNKTSFTKDFVFGGAQRPNWIRVHAGGAAAIGAAASAALQYALYAEFTVAVNGTTVVSNRQSGDTGISVAASGSTNGIRVTINGGTNGSYARAWIEVYSENGVYW